MTGMAFSPRSDGTLATTASDGTLRTWAVSPRGQVDNTGRAGAAMEMYSTKHTANGLVWDNSLNAVCWGAWRGRSAAILLYTLLTFCLSGTGALDGKLVAGSTDGDVYVFDSERADADPTCYAQGATARANSTRAVGVLGGGQSIVSGGSDGAVRIYDHRTADGPVHTLADLHNRKIVRALATGDGGDLFATAGWDGRCNVVDARTWATVHTIEGYEKCQGVKIDQGRLLVGGQLKKLGVVKLVDLASGDLIAEMSEPDRPVIAVALRGEFLAVSRQVGSDQKTAGEAAQTYKFAVGDIKEEAGVGVAYEDLARSSF